MKSKKRKLSKLFESKELPAKKFLDKIIEESRSLELSEISAASLERDPIIVQGVKETLILTLYSKVRRVPGTPKFFNQVLPQRKKQKIPLWVKE